MPLTIDGLMKHGKPDFRTDVDSERISETARLLELGFDI